MKYLPASPLECLLLDAEKLRGVLTPLEIAQWISWKLHRGIRFLDKEKK